LLPPQPLSLPMDRACWTAIRYVSILTLYCNKRIKVLILEFLYFWLFSLYRFFTVYFEQQRKQQPSGRKDVNLARDNEICASIFISSLEFASGWISFISCCIADATAGIAQWPCAIKAEDMTFSAWMKKKMNTLGFCAKHI
jgi:hypothetical protein